MAVGQTPLPVVNMPYMTHAMLRDPHAERLQLTARD